MAEQFRPHPENPKQHGPEAGAGPLGISSPDLEQTVQGGGSKSLELDRRGQGKESPPAQRRYESTLVQPLELPPPDQEQSKPQSEFSEEVGLWRRFNRLNQPKYPPANTQLQQGRAESNPLTSPDEQKEQGNGAKLSRIPEQTVAFIQHAFATSADNNLKEHQRIFLAHAVTKPHLTIMELAPFIGRKEDAARKLWERSLYLLWHASPPELQKRYPLLDLSKRNRKVARIHSPEHRVFSPESRAKIVAAHAGKRHTPESRARMSKAHAGKRHTPESRAKISEAQKRRWERRKQQEADLTQKEQKYPPLRT